MPAKYNLVNDFSKFSQSNEEFSTSPFWVISVIRLGVPLSFSRASMSSVKVPKEDGVASRSKPLVITSDCVSLSINNSKANYTKQLTATLKNVEFNYFIEILPGDWVMAWIVNDEDSFNQLLKKVRKPDPNNPCNEFQDGLKFMGRVDSVRKMLSQDPGGVRTVSYSLSAVGFREFDATLFYEEALANQDYQNGLGTWLYRIGIDVANLLKVREDQGRLENNASEIISKILDIMLGVGVRPNSGGGNTLPVAGSITSESAPYAYLVPQTIASYLGISSGEITNSKKFFSYADLLVLVRGVQQYADSNGDMNDPSIFKVSNSLSKISTNQRIVTDATLLGGAVPQAPNFCNQPLWHIMSQFLNGPLNEMYTCLRTNTMSLFDGTGHEVPRIMPTLVVRQTPFNTEALPDSALVSTGIKADDAQKVTATKFLSLPRWVIHPTMVKSANIGRSDATRFNFVHIYGQSPSTQSNQELAKIIVENPPIRDDLDIQRSGLRSYMTTVNCLNVDQFGTTPSTWMRLLADWMIGQQYTANGTLAMIGVQSPICEGDNLEWDGIVYHIEGINHVCSIDPSGNKSFITNLALTNGMRDGGRNDTSLDTPLYPGLLSNDNTQYDPGKTVEDANPRYTYESYDNITAEQAAEGVPAGTLGKATSDTLGVDVGATNSGPDWFFAPDDQTPAAAVNKKKKGHK